MKQTPVVVLDLETTGLSPHRHKITEIAAVKVQGREILDSFHTLVNPEQPIPRFITKLTGITDDMVKDAPTIEHALPSLKEFMGDLAIVGHNVAFDYGFLAHNFRQYCGEQLVNDRLCTCKLARRMLPDLPSKKLSSVCDYFGLVNEQAHRAMADVEVTVKIFDNFISTLDTYNVSSFSDVVSFEKLSLARAQELLRK